MATQRRGDEMKPTESATQPTLKEKINKRLTVKKFMCCCSLRTGCLVIGYVNTIISFACIVFFCVIWSMVYADATLICMFLFDILIFTILFSLHVVLLFGVYEERRDLITSYLRGIVVMLIILFLIDVVVIIFITSAKAKRLVHYLWSIYSLLVVRSYNIQLAKAEKEENQMNLA